MEPQIDTQQQARTVQQVADKAAAAVTQLPPGTALLPVAAPVRHKPIVGKGRPTDTAMLIRRRSDIGAIWLKHRLDPAFREEIMVAVAGANSCRHCSYAHREWALAVGLPEADLAALEGMDAEAFDARTWAAVAWAHAAAAGDFTEVPPEIDANFRKHFSAQEQSDIDLVARVMTWMNGVSNSVDASVLRLKRNPVPGSRVLGEVAALLAYGIVVPAILVGLSVGQRRSLRSMVRGMPAFFREFDAR